MQATCETKFDLFCINLVARAQLFCGQCFNISDLGMATLLISCH